SYISEDPKTLDPTVAYDTLVSGILAQICDTYLQYNYLKRDPLVLEPLLGASMPVRQPYDLTTQDPLMGKNGAPVTDSRGKPVTHAVLHHGEVWTFTIKRGIHYADDPCFANGRGREVTAADFVYSFKRMADPSVNCPILSYITPHVVGMQAFFDAEASRMAAAKKAGKEYLCNLDAPVQGVQLDTHNPYVFRLILQDKYPQLKYLMAMQFTAPIPHEAIEYYNGGPHGQFRMHPVGAGPYRLAEWDERHRIVLERNPYYHTDRYPTQGAPGDTAAGLLADAGKPLPFDDRIVFTVIPESVPGWNLFQQGYLDSYGVPKETFDKVITTRGALSPEMKARGIILQTAPGMDVNYLAFNMEDSLVGGYTPKKRKLRQALSLAFDSKEFLDLILNGRGITAQSPLPPGLFGYDPGYQDPYRQTNLAKAKQLLAEAGYPGGIDPATGSRLEINYDDSGATPDAREQNGLVIRQLERLGIKVNERQQTFAVFQDRVNSGQFQLISFGWVADYPDPENFYLLFYGPNKGPGPNSARYNNPEFDAVFRQMASMDDGPERLKLIHRLRDILQEDCPWIYNFHSLSYGLRYDWLKNAKPHPVAYNSAKYIRIDYAERARKQAEWNRPRYDVVAGVIVVLVLGCLPAILAARRRRQLSARANRRTLVSPDGSWKPTV
ncbi:MAG: ABC transporter substrate-binding protein, partial [Chloroflexi bacterium]|nr:ABC transporter substrate-binding protein [Chloroflexota bacterium]